MWAIAFGVAGCALGCALLRTAFTRLDALRLVSYKCQREISFSATKNKYRDFLTLATEAPSRPLFRLECGLWR